jgi:hypothetical protein
MVNILKTYLYDELLSICAIIFVCGWHYRSTFQGGVGGEGGVHLIQGMNEPSF